MLLISLGLALGGVSGLLVPRAVYRLAVAPALPCRSACPQGHPLTGGALNSWLGSARCTNPSACRPFGPARRVAPLTTAVVSAMVASAVGPRPELLVWLLLAPCAVTLAIVDWRVHRLPDALTLPMAGATLVLLGAAALSPGHHGSWQTAVFGAVTLGAAYLLLVLIHPSGMGLGDVKLALSVGAILGWHGWGALVVGAFAAFLLGGLYGTALLLLGRADRQTAVPFAPMMLLGALAGPLLEATGGLR